MSTVSRFLLRWSQMKRAATAGAAPAALPPLAGLDADADLSAYLRPDVDEPLRRQALRLIFSDPRLNVMDGLDTYIDDYSIADPIPQAMLAQLNQARRLFADDADGVGDVAPSAAVQPADQTLDVDTDDAAGAAVPRAEGETQTG